MNSDKPLTQLIELSYTEDLLDKETGRKLVDFIKGGYKLVTVGLMFNNQEKKNIIYKKQERIRANQIQFGRDENGRAFFLKKAVTILQVRQEMKPN